MNSLSGSGWQRRERHNEHPALAGKPLSYGTEAHAVIESCGVQDHKKGRCTVDEGHRCHCLHHTLNPGHRCPSAMHRVDASSKKLWPILEYLFCVAMVLLLYIRVPTSDRAGFHDKGQDKNNSSLAHHTHSATSPRRTENRKRTNEHAESSKCMHIKNKS